MSGSGKVWREAVIDLRRTLASARDSSLALGRDAQLADTASAYIHALTMLEASLLRSRKEPSLGLIQGLVGAAGMARHLHGRQDLRGLLRDTYAALSALPGDPGSTPPTIPPPPGDDD